MRSRGVAIVIVLLVLSVMTVVATAVVTLGTGNLAMAGTQVLSERAYYAAESGLAVTLVRLQADENYAGATAPETVVGGQDTYSSTVYRLPAVPPNGVVLPGPEYRYILAEGATPNGSYKRQVAMMVKVEGTQFNYAAFAKNKVTLSNGALVDWYDSNTGLVPPGGKGDVGSNLAAANAIVVSASSQVKGGAYVAPGAPASAVKIDASSSVTNGRVNMLTTQNLGPVVPFGTLPVPTDGKVMPLDPALGLDLTISASTVLPPGVYHNVVIQSDADVTLVDGGIYVFENLNINGGTLHVALGTVAPIELWINHDFTIQKGSMVNDTAKPPLMKVYGATGSHIKLKADKKDPLFNPTGYYSVYAPDGDIQLDGGEDKATGALIPTHVYGSLVGNNITIKDGSIVTYDMALQSGGGGSTNLEVLFHDRL